MCVEMNCIFLTHANLGGCESGAFGELALFPRRRIRIV